MKIPKLLSLLVCCFLFQGCEETSSETGDIQSVADNIQGKWNWTSADVSLLFLDGRTVKDKSTYKIGDQYLDFKVLKTDGNLISGTVITSGSISSASGVWNYDFSNSKNLLKIEFTSQSPSINLFRKVDRLDKTHLDMSAQNELLVMQYEANAIKSLIASGSVSETYVK